VALASQFEKGQIFAALHERDRAFIIPNPWDVGTARLLAQLGFEALATTSAGYSFSMGQPDNSVARANMLRHVASIAAATDLPVSADLENGFGDSPKGVAETIRLAAGAGLVGGSIEDMSRHQGRPIYELEVAVDRVRAGGLQGVQLSMAELSAIGVKRISVGSALARAALGAFLRAAREMQEYGTFTFAEQAVGYRDINAMFSQ
jgi:2-methylisocitrate lyase-like PEP mutase family enzyme